MKTSPLPGSDYRRWLFPAIAWTSALLPLPAGAQAPDPEAAHPDFFEKKVRPLLVENCYSCHSAETKPSGGLRVDDRNGLLQGGNAGPAVVPGNPDQSLLMQRLRHADEKKRMPKESDPLSAEEVETVATWIRNGAAWPHERLPSSIGRVRPAIDELKTKHWSWQPLTDPAVPPVSDTSWPRGGVDNFVLARLEKEKLVPADDASRATLIRRVSFDLTGLPPSPEEITRFENDPSPGAFETLVDRLLESPAFGEQWARHWLDVARYGESTGPSRNIPYPHAWKYRDYVIDAVQRDVPYDRFIQEQIAGDLLPAGSREERDRLATATGYLALGVKDVNQRFKTRFLMDNVDEQIDVVSRSIIGLTVSCARCHDHKFDPIGMQDYYSLAGIFASTDDCAGVRNKMGGGGLDYYDPAMLIRLSTEAPEAPPEQVAKLQKEVAEAKEAWDAIRGTPEGLKKAPDGRPVQRPFRLKYEKLQGELLALTDPAARGEAVHGVREGKVIGDTELRIRGEAERLGPVVPRGFLTTFGVPDAPSIPPDQSGRLQLAQWLTSPKHPLTARVVVNRVWAQLFGRGIVSTVDNFGAAGDVPSHPELLDYLASTFIRDGWSVKRTIRRLVLSRTYQLGSGSTESNRLADPDNRLLWRHSPRRLTAEEVRDAILAGTGRLQPPPGGASPAGKLRMTEMRDNGQEARTIHTAADNARHRSLYLPLLRGVTPKSLEAFDPVTQSLVTARRDATTVPTQALFLLNGSFVREQSLSFGESLSRNAVRTEAESLGLVYQQILGRLPTAEETTRASRFLAEYAVDFRQGQPESPVVAENQTGTGQGDETGATVLPPVNPDDVDRTDALAPESAVQPGGAEAAAWMALVQALFASAEFRFVR